MTGRNLALLLIVIATVCAIYYYECIYSIETEEIYSAVKPLMGENSTRRASEEALKIRNKRRKGPGKNLLIIISTIGSFFFVTVFASIYYSMRKRLTLGSGSVRLAKLKAGVSSRDVIAKQQEIFEQGKKIHSEIERATDLDVDGKKVEISEAERKVLANHMARTRPGVPEMTSMSGGVIDRVKSAARKVIGSFGSSVDVLKVIDDYGEGTVEEKLAAQKLITDMQNIINTDYIPPNTDINLEMVRNSEFMKRWTKDRFISDTFTAASKEFTSARYELRVDREKVLSVISDESKKERTSFSTLREEKGLDAMSKLMEVRLEGSFLTLQSLVDQHRQMFAVGRTGYNGPIISGEEEAKTVEKMVRYQNKILIESMAPSIVTADAESADVVRRSQKLAVYENTSADLISYLQSGERPADTPLKIEGSNHDWFLACVEALNESTVARDSPDTDMKRSEVFLKKIASLYSSEKNLDLKKAEDFEIFEENMRAEIELMEKHQEAFPVGKSISRSIIDTVISQHVAMNIIGDIVEAGSKDPSSKQRIREDYNRRYEDLASRSTEILSDKRQREIDRYKEQDRRNVDRAWAEHAEVRI